MLTLANYKPGSTELLLGNEAIARGALEAGVKVAASYPGTPASEVIESLAPVAKEAGIYVEWSVNEKVAAEVAGAASYAGLRSLVAMKQEGMNVALDFLAHLNLSGTVGGMVLLVGDDPEGWSSPGENDSRTLVRWLNVPLLEPATAQEAKDMTRWAFEQSERLGLYFVLRSVTRVCHATGPVVIGERPTFSQAPRLDVSKSYVPTPPAPKHVELLKKIARARDILEDSPFNYYQGPEKPDLLVVASGAVRLYAQEAIEYLGLGDSVGLVHVGTTSPLPRRFVASHLSRSSRVLIAEEVDPFLESSVKELAGDIGWLVSGRQILGKGSGHIPMYGELNPDILIRALAKVLDVEYRQVDPSYEARARQLAGNLVVERDPAWCAGCPHRASLWAMKNALRLDGRDGVVAGDIGCYSLDRRGEGGYRITRTASAMGSGAGIASGLGKLAQFGFDQPVLALCGDSTFYHAAIPALINATYNRSNFTLVVLDNSATALTGFQPHPGVGRNAMESQAPVVEVEAVCRSLGIDVRVLDPYGVDEATDTVLNLMQQRDGVKVLIFKRKCVLLGPRDAKPSFKMWVEQDMCLADACGCSRYCTRAFKCPGLVVDLATGKARIDEAMCIGCGVCASVCPVSAIRKEPVHA